MATKYFYVSVEYPTIGGDPLDNSHNTFTWRVPDAYGDTAAIDFITAQIDEFLNTTPLGGTLHLSALLGLQLSRASDAVVLRFYDITAHLDGSRHGPPIGVRTLTLTTGDATGPPLPEGVACALTMHASYAGDEEFGPAKTRPRARDRGRMYFGPVSHLCFSEDGTTHRIYVSAGLQLHLASAAARMSFQDAANPSWGIWSRVNASVKGITGGWVDNRFDYQRLREDQGNARYLWVADTA